MKAVVASLFAVLIAAAPLSASSDDSKTLTNTKGQVAYGPSNPAANALPVRGRTALSDNDWASTGANSLASVTLPDSSEVILGQNTTVQMNSFQQTDIAHAKFTIQIGKVRFKVNHPQGAKADYTFQTTTGQIAVRGTEGDISTNPAGLQVNVYAVSNPALPVQVTLANGQVFTLAAGQSLVAGAAAGAITASVTTVSQSLYSPFTEFAAPANASSLGIASAAGAATGAATTTAIVAGAAVAGTAAAVVTSSQSTTAPAPTQAPTQAPSPTPSTTSVPITVSGAGRNTPNNGHRPGPRPSPLP